MELNELNCFLAVAESGSITVAARELGLSEVTVSRQIAKLEEGLTCPLLVRKKNHIQLNEYGKRILMPVYDLVGEMESLRKEVIAVSCKGKKKIRVIATSLDFFRWILPKMDLEVIGTDIERIIMTRPQLEQAILKRQGDIIISPVYYDYQWVLCVPLYENRLFVTAPENHPLAEKSRVTIEELEGETFLVPEAEGIPLIRMFREEKEKRGIKIDCRVENDNLVMRDMLAKTDRYLGFATSFTYEYHKMIKGRKVIYLDSDELKESNYILYYKDNYEAVMPFVNWILNHYSKSLREQNRANSSEKETPAGAELFIKGEDIYD
ncbi:MAG: LysR family transcriptional regulator [Oscillospiraceae bacterium]|nr:LysR family transcriptional regulator [Oscillospiraceae bacterium]